MSNITRDEDGRNRLAEESFSFVADIRDFVVRNRPWLLAFCDEIERAAELLVADQQGRVDQAQLRLQAERAALSEAQCKQDQVKEGTARIRAEFRNAEKETTDYDLAIRDAAGAAGYPYLRVVAPLPEVIA